MTKGNPWGKFTQQFWAFVIACREGERALFISPYYICMDKKSYDQFCGELERKKIRSSIVFDEYGGDDELLAELSKEKD